MHSSCQGAEELEYGLIVLWEMLENQAPLLEGREADIFTALLQIRYCAQANVRAAVRLSSLPRAVFLVRWTRTFVYVSLLLSASNR